LCEDENVIGAPFTLVEHVSGATVRTAADLDELDDRAVGTVSRRLVETLAALAPRRPRSGRVGGLRAT